MPKAIEKVPETVAELKAALPDLCARIEEDAKASIDTAAIAACAVTAALDRVWGIIAVEMGDEISASLSTLAATGITVDQLKAVKALQPPPASAGPTPEGTTKAALLAAITNSGAPNPGQGGPATPPDSDKDYMTLVEEYAATHTCSRSDAMQAVTRKHPAKHKEYIKKQNEGRA